MIKWAERRWTLQSERNTGARRITGRNTDETQRNTTVESDLLKRFITAEDAQDRRVSRVQDLSASRPTSDCYQEFVWKKCVRQKISASKPGVLMMSVSQTPNAKQTRRPQSYASFTGFGLRPSEFNKAEKSHSHYRLEESVGHCKKSPLNYSFAWFSPL